MDRELIEKSYFYLFRHEDRILEVDKFFSDVGFSRVYNIDSLEGKVLSTSYGNYDSDFIVFPVNSLEEESEGYRVVQDSDEMFFGDFGKDGVNIFKKSGLDLFIPKYFVEKGFFFVGDDVNFGNIHNNSNVKWEHPPKIYLSDEELKMREPELYEKYFNYAKSKEFDFKPFTGIISYIAKNFGIDIEFENRLKSPISIHAKLEKKRKGEKISLENFNDLSGIRFLPENINDCYKILSMINRDFFTINGFKDLIAVPKSNGYQGLICRLNNSLEIQIQTPKMRTRGKTDNYRVNYSS